MKISPSGIATFYEDRREFYLKYLSPNKPPRFPQTRPMSIGSAFDAYVKAYLVKQLYGEVIPGFDWPTLFEDGVEPHNRDWAKENGRYVFATYLRSGALADLIVELEMASNTPSFETTVHIDLKQIGIDTDIILRGIPDLDFIGRNGRPVVFDWKVNGYCSKRRISPAKGYLKLRSGDTVSKHPQCITAEYHGITYNTQVTMDQVDAKWGLQECCYGWILGVPLGEPFLAGVDQVVCEPTSGFPLLRIATHRCLIKRDFQMQVHARIKHMVECIESDHIFDDLSVDESRARCRELDKVGLGFEKGGPDAAKLLRGL